jgi:MAP kinase interacting serine/threonine kinase
MPDQSVDNATTIPKSTTTRRKKKRRAADAGVKSFKELYAPTGENLGQGSFGSVKTYKNLITNQEMAVKTIEVSHEKSRHKVLKEIEIFHHCKGHDNILQLIEYFEEDDKFFMVFEKMEGGTLLETIEDRGSLTEQEASLVVRDIAKALNFLHQKGIAHRDLKPENILCVKAGQLVPVKICDFDLGSGVVVRDSNKDDSPITTPELQTPVGSAEFMAPEVVNVWQDQAWSYDKRCDLWSLGIILYILLCGYPPFYGHCGRECGWEQGEVCKDCQDQLFERIQDGEFEFHRDDWVAVSDDAKDLIRHLLVKDPYQRYSAQEVLNHPWVSMESSMAQLATPHVLQRNNSIKELDNFAENANALNRMIQRHLSISEAFQPPSFQVGGVLEEDSDEDNQLKGVPVVNVVFESGETAIFHMDSDHSGSEGDGEDVAPILWMGMSPPGSSALARRRAFKNQGSESTSDETPEESPKLIRPIYHGRSPPKVPSAMF